MFLFLKRHYRTLISLCLPVMLAGCRFYFDTTSDQFTAHQNQGSLQRGKNLLFTVCGSCHYDPSVKKFIGKPLNDLPRIAGKLYTANLTNSPSHGLPPHYTDAELFYLVKTGIGKDGRFMPYMMKPMMADEDINDIIVYLRSGDDPVAAADTTVGRTRINLIGKTGIRVIASPQPYNKGIQRPDEDNPVAYGYYTASIISCYHCHSSRVVWLDFLTPEKTKGYMQGGLKLKDPDGNKIRSSNLTPDKETGIGRFTKQDFRQAVREGMAPSGGRLSPVMPKFRYLTDKQTDAIYAYLQSLAPVHHAVKTKN